MCLAKKNVYAKMYMHMQNTHDRCHILHKFYISSLKKAYTAKNKFMPG